MQIPEPNYISLGLDNECEGYWSPMAGGGVDVWVGADASDFPEVLEDLPSVELARTPWSNDTEIVVDRSEDNDYVYIIHRYPGEGGDTGTVFRYYKSFD